MQTQIKIFLKDVPVSDGSVLHLGTRKDGYFDSARRSPKIATLCLLGKWQTDGSIKGKFTFHSLNVESDSELGSDSYSRAMSNRFSSPAKPDPIQVDDTTQPTTPRTCS